MRMRCIRLVRDGGADEKAYWNGDFEKYLGMVGWGEELEIKERLNIVMSKGWSGRCCRLNIHKNKLFLSST